MTTTKEVLILKNELAHSMKGKPYCRLTFREQGGKTGVLNLYNNYQPILDHLKEKEVYFIETDWTASFPTIQSYQPGTSAISLFTNYLFPSQDYALTLLNQLIGLITDSDLKTLLERIFTEEVKQAFILAPAAVRHHHPECGGLLQHTREMMEFIYQITSNPHYQMVNFQVALTGALLHDISKLEEYTFGLLEPTEVTKEYLLGGHLSLGAELVGRQAQELDENKIANVKHIIRSHHFLPEWGAVAKPATLEAHLVFLADSWSSTLNRYTHCEFDPITRIGEVAGQKFVNLN